MGIGAGAAVWIGGALTVGSTTALTTIGAVVAGAINGAIVGAVVGGLTSMVTGGNIGQGMLVGAIGGAIGGGIMGAFNPGAFGVGSSELAASEATAVTSPGGWEGVVAAGGDVSGSAGGATTIAPTVTSVPGGGAGGGGLGLDIDLGKTGGELLAGGIKEGVGQLMGSKAASEAQEFTAEQAALDREQRLTELQMQLDAAGASSSSAPKSQQLSSTLAKAQADTLIQREGWRREDKAKAKISGAAKSLGTRRNPLTPQLTDAEIQAIEESGNYIEPETGQSAQDIALETQKLV